MIGVEYKTTEDVMKEKEREATEIEDSEQEYNETLNVSLHSHIVKTFQQNRMARETSGVNELMLDCLRAYNGEYSSEELALIQREGGSKIYMNLTSTKVRAAISWIKDILLASKEEAWSIRPTTVPELPEDQVAQIEERISVEFEEIAAELDGDIPATLKEAQERRRDLYDAIQEEIKKEAAFAFKIIEDDIRDSFEEGGWSKALSQFIDDFCIFPTAVLKGPIITKRKKLEWENGIPVVEDEYVFVNKRISPFDIYPAPEAETPCDGNFIEHIRLSRKELSSFIGNRVYKQDKLKTVLDNDIGKGYPIGLDGNVEDRKAQQEMRHDANAANENVYHGLHFWGSASVKLLRDWGYDEAQLVGKDDNEELDIEAIVVGSEVIKCRINKDPLGRRPYYTSSFQKRPGSFWGSCPPYLMRDIQRMCNACARALSNNMGLSSGPIMEVYIDRLASGQEVSELRPRDIVQVTTDPTGASGRAVQFFTIPSVANELMAVYKEFELRADDVTMIPRYAYGNERSGGAAQTASGLSMLLESASKGIKDAIRHIDEDVIIPRVKTEFYYKMLDKGSEYLFSGDIEVVAYGSSTLTLKGAQQMRRNEFLQITANPIDSEIMGPHGRAEILRVVAKDLGLGENVIPGRMEIKKAVLAKQQAQAEQVAAPVQAAQIQNEANLQMSRERNEIAAADLNRKQAKDQTDAQLKIAELDVRSREGQQRSATELQKTQAKIASDEHQANQAIALSLQTGDKANSV